MSENKMTTQSPTEADLPIQDLVPKAIECADRLLKSDSVLLASHIDADGLTSAGIAATLLERSNTEFETRFFKQLDEDKIESVAQTDHSTVLFTDFGSGQLDDIVPHEEAGDFTPVIADHHEPADVDTKYHLNPIKYGINGSSELSGAGTVYVIARCMAHLTDKQTPQQNKDLSALAVVGATGDMQGSAEGMSGANTEIVSEGVEHGVITKKKDLTLYGKQSRPLPKLLEYSTDIRIPRITGSETGATQFLNEIDIKFTESDGTWRRWVDLTEEEKQTVASNLIQTAIKRGVPNYRVDEVIGTTYELSQEEERTALRDVSEFSTLLNATARYERQDVGLAVCLGDRG
jgi:RecJ-like exonuclease